MEEKEINEIFKNSARNIYGDSISEEELDAIVQAHLDKRKNIKKTKEAVHIQYLGESIKEEDFIEYERKLNEVELELSRFDESGEVKQNFEDYLLISFVLVNEHVFSNLFSDVKGNLKWDVIKYLLESIYRKLKGKKYFRTQSEKTEERPISFGLKVKMDKNTQFDFSCTDLDNETFDASLDKILEFLKTQKKYSKYQLPKFVEYDSKKKKWVEIDVMKEIRKKINKKKK
jgi:hypothetical protein